MHRLATVHVPDNQVEPTKKPTNLTTNQPTNQRQRRTEKVQTLVNLPSRLQARFHK